MNHKHFLKPAILFSGLAVAFILWRFTPLGEHFKIENVQALARFAESLGPVAPIIYVAAYGIGAVLLVPGSVLTLTGGLSFGVFWGTLFVSLGSCLGAALAFLVARYLARPTVERLIAGRASFGKLDQGVKAHGWRMVAVTRLVPVFPYMFINYAFGLTDVRFTTYVIVTYITMLPANFALCLASGSIVSGGDDWKVIILYLALAGVLISGLSFLPLLLKRKLPEQITSELDGKGIKKGSGGVLRPITIAFAVLFLFAALVAGYLYHTGSKRADSIITAYENKIQNQKTLKERLWGKALRLENHEDQFLLLRNRVREMVGEREMVLFESDVCKAWETASAHSSFTMVACKKDGSGKWHQAGFEGPFKYKGKLYHALESALHPVLIRKCLYAKDNNDQVKVFIQLQDLYNVNPLNIPLPVPDQGDDDFNLDGWLLQKERIRELKKQSENLQAELTDVFAKAKKSEMYRTRTLLLGLTLQRLDDPIRKPFSLSEMEQESFIK